MDLGNLLTSLKCKELHIARQSLGREETRALVQAIESSVEKVMLDIEALTEYGGQGQCMKVLLDYARTADRYGEEIRSWAKSINWAVDNYFENRNHNYVRVTKKEALSPLSD